MAKIQPKDPGSFELVDTGDYLFRGKRAKVVPPQDTSQGWLYQVWMAIEGGEFDGIPHFESYFTSSQFGDGLDGCRHLLKMLNAMGRIPDERAVDFDSEKFESQAFADRFESMVVDALVGGTIIHKVDKKTDKKWARISKYWPPKSKPAPEKKPAPKGKEFDF